ncbi:MAG: hypothetical protein V4560_15100 [Bacteroidota bacterium]|jgi:hypothetical protein
MLIKPKPLLVVTGVSTSFIVPAKNQEVRVTDMNRLFPVIHELLPGSIVLDHDYMGRETEKILRRIRSNPFYSKIKIYCYKSHEETKVDDLLKVLGVQQFIYAEDPTSSKIKNTIKPLIDIRYLAWSSS